MKVTRFRRTGGEALSSHVDSSGQYTTYIFSAAPTDSETRQMYRPERRAGLSVLASGEVINFAELSRRQSQELDYELERDIHCVVNDTYRNQKANNLLFASIDPSRLDLKLVKSLEIDIRQGHVSIGRYFVQETFE